MFICLVQVRVIFSAKYTGKKGVIRVMHYFNLPILIKMKLNKMSYRSEAFGRWNQIKNLWFLWTHVKYKRIDAL